MNLAVQRGFSTTSRLLAGNDFGIHREDGYEGDGFWSCTAHTYSPRVIMRTSLNNIIPILAHTPVVLYLLPRGDLYSFYALKYFWIRFIDMICT